MMNANVIKVLRDNYTSYQYHDATFYEWLVNNPENDESIVENLFDGWDGSVESLDDEQKAEFDEWMSKLEKESEYSKHISEIEGCYIDVYDYFYINDDADLVVFHFGEYGETTSAVIYDDGTVFTPRDWQSGEFPQEPAEIKNYSWMELSSKQGAIVFDGLPRLLGYEKL